MKYIIDNDLHIHSYLSKCSNDPEQTTERLLQYAKDNNLKTICLTDHYWDREVPGAHDWYREQDFNYISQSKPLPKADGIRFLFGCEAELSKDLKITIPKEKFKEFDFVIISTTHLQLKDVTVYEEDVETIEKRAETWIKRLDTVLDMDLPFHKIGIAHLATYLIKKKDREGYLKLLDMIPDEELYRLFKKASEKGVGIELNYGDMKFSDEEANTVLRPFKIAKECGCKFYFGCDAHHPASFLRTKEVFQRAVDFLELEETDKFII